MYGSSPLLGYSILYVKDAPHIHEPMYSAALFIYFAFAFSLTLRSCPSRLTPMQRWQLIYFESLCGLSGYDFSPHALSNIM